MRLRNQLLLYIIVYITIPFLIFSSVAIYLINQSSIDKEKKYFTRNISNLSMEMTQYLSAIESSSYIFAQNPTIVSAPLEDKKKLLKNFYNQMDHAVKNIYLVDQNGQIITIYPETKQNVNSLSFANRNCFLNVKETKKSQLTGVTTSIITKQTTSCLAEPLLFSNGQFTGMIGMELNFDKAQELIQQKGFQDYSYYLLDVNQNVIASNQKNILNPTLFKTIVKDSSPLEVRDIIVNDKKQHVVYSPLKNYPYSIVAFVPEARFLQSVIYLQIQFYMWVLFSIGSLLFLGYLFRKKILSPIENFAQITKQITNDALNHPMSSLYETVEIQNKGELSDLSENFNQMVQALKLREDHLHRRRLGLIRTIVELLELNDPNTAGHSYRVYEYSSLIANQLGLPKDQVQDVETAALLHDIGKIGISLEILNKPGKLNAIEYDQIKQHTIIGSQVLARIDQFDRVRDAILHHHEHFDGKGYPFMLSGEKISFEARIISVADAFDAMTSNRPYRTGMSIERAYQIILEESGKQFDPSVVKAFRYIFAQQYDLLKQVHMTQIYTRVSYLAN